MSRTRRGRGKAAIAGLLALVAAACGDDGPTGPALELEEIDQVTYHESLGIDLERMQVTESGVYWIDLEVGEGAEAVSGADVTVSFLARTRDGSVVHSSEIQGPLAFTVDALDVEGSPFPGVHDGVRGMREGGTRKFIVPPELADRKPGPTGILIFDVELVSASEPDGS